MNEKAVINIITPLDLKRLPEPKDAADALALAICPGHNLKSAYV